MKANGHYILDADGKTPILEPDLLTWARWFEKTSNRRLAKDQLSKTVWVSTVFLGLDHRYGEGAALLWETMIFGLMGGDGCEYQERYESYDDALKGHKKAVHYAKERLSVESAAARKES